jgi:hypothetical protein
MTSESAKASSKTRRWRDEDGLLRSARRDVDGLLRSTRRDVGNEAGRLYTSEDILN